MSRQLEQRQEEQTKRRERTTLLAVYGGLEEAVGRAGGVLTGFSAKLGEVDVLLTLRADFPAGPMIAFCGAETLAGALRKAVTEGRGDRLRWREDSYRT